MELLAVFLGGGIGSSSRYLLSKIINQHSNTLFPLGTLAVNIAGCFIIGIAFELFEKIVLPNEIRIFIITGFLGGFTTFSSFSLETVNLIKSNEILNSVVNIAVSIILGLVFVTAGMLLARLCLNKWR